MTTSLTARYKLALARLLKVRSHPGAAHRIAVVRLKLTALHFGGSL